MNPCQYCFIFKGEGLSPENCSGSFSSESFKVTVFGVDTFENAVHVAKKSVDSGVTLVELCGDFNQEIADQIRLAINNKATVRFVSYDPEELKKLELLESDENYGFIIMDEGLEPDKNLIKLLDDSVYITGVSNIEQACECAKGLVKNNINFIELCSAFDQPEALAVIEAINGKVPVGYSRK